MSRLFVVAVTVAVASGGTDCNYNVGDDASYDESIEAASDANNGFIRRITSTGCPNYITAPVGDNENHPEYQDKNYSINAYPCFASSSYNVTCTGGDVGITLNGVSILSYYPGTCGEDAVTEEGDTFDKCSGHASVDGTYHYHVTPSCLLDQLDDYYDVTEHSPLIGWAFDGFPVYGPHTHGGALIYPCNHTLANASRCVDWCGGTEQYEIDGFKYHYHLLGPIGDLQTEPTSPLPNNTMQPYTIGCLKGVVYDWSMIAGTSNGATCDGDGYKTEYTPNATEGVTSTYTYSAPTKEPTLDPTTDPTLTPTTADPTTTALPTTADPTTASPSEEPTNPTEEPTTFVPTEVPTTWLPTSDPTTVIASTMTDSDSDSVDSGDDAVTMQLGGAWLVMMAALGMLN
jgi:hypothetical protein